MKKKLFAMIFATVFATIATAAPFPVQKPIMCAPSDEVFQMLTTAPVSEVPVFQAVSGEGDHATVIIIFMNSVTKTLSVVELIRPEPNQVKSVACMLADGTDIVVNESVVGYKNKKVEQKTKQNTI